MPDQYKWPWNQFPFLHDLHHCDLEIHSLWFLMQVIILELYLLDTPQCLIFDALSLSQPGTKPNVAWIPLFPKLYLLYILQNILPIKNRHMNLLYLQIWCRRLSVHHLWRLSHLPWSTSWPTNPAISEFMFDICIRILYKYCIYTRFDTIYEYLI